MGRLGELIEQDGSPARSASAEIVASGGAMQQTRSSYATAIMVQKPRSMSEVRKRLEEEADLAGEDFYYGWGGGRDRIEGGSIELALSAARCWGNCVVENLPVVETPTAWVFTAAFIDLETGFTLSRQFRQSKNHQVFGKHDEERKTDIRFQIGQSKAIRNVVLNAVPKSLINRALDKAKQGVRSQIEKFIEQKGIVSAVEIVMRSLAKVGVKEDRVLSKLAIADRKAIDIEHLVILRGDLHAIDSGQAYADDLFPSPESALERKMAEAKPSNGNGKTNGNAHKSKPAEPQAETKLDAPEQPDSQEPHTDLSDYGHFYDLCAAAAMTHDISEADLRAKLQSALLAAGMVGKHLKTDLAFREKFLASVRANFQ